METSSPSLPAGDRLWWLFWPALLIVAISGAAWRAGDLGGSLWLDELHTAWSIAAGPEELPRRAAAGNQPPAYAWLTWAVVTLGGPSEILVRLPAYLSGVLLPPCLGLLLRHWTASPLAGVLAAFVAAVDPDLIFFSQEARPYALVQLVALGQVAACGKLLTAPSNAARLAWVLLSAALFHLHYTTALLVLAEAGAYLALALGGRWNYLRLDWLRPAYTWRKAVVDAALVALAWAPAWPHVAQIADRRGAWALFAPRPTLLDLLLLFPLEVCVGLPLAGLALAAVVRWLGKFDRSAGGLVRPPADLRRVVLAAFWLLAPLALAWVLARTDLARLFVRRYLIASLPAAMAAAGLFVAAVRPPGLRLCIAGLVAAGAFARSTPAIRPVAGAPWQWPASGVRPQEDWRGSLAWLAAQDSHRGAPVLVASGLIEAEGLRSSHGRALREFCLLPVTGFYALPGSREYVPLPFLAPGRLTEEAAAALERHRGGWVVIRGQPEFGARVRRQLESDLRRRGVGLAVAEEQSFSGVQIFRIAPAPT